MSREKQFALGTYEIELQSRQEKKYILQMFKDIVGYIDTAIDYNNDYLLREDTTGYKAISKISFCHTSNYEFFVSNHLKCLNREYIDIMLIHSNRGDWTDLALKVNKDSRFKEVGVSNFTKEDIEKYKEVVGKYPAYNEVEINPYYTDKETIEFCVSNNIKVIAYAVLGGKYNAMRNIADFSLPYLLQYACKYADIVIIKPESYRHAEEFKDVIVNYTGDLDDFKEIDIDAVSKSIEPMKYRVPPVQKTYLSKPTYHNAVGENIGNLLEKELDIELPEFEMLGDYKTYLRYLYRQNYSDSRVYDYDFLVGDDGNYYVVYIYEGDKLTKVTGKNTKVVSYQYTRGEENGI